MSPAEYIEKNRETYTNDGIITRHDYQKALWSQSAVNASGLIFSLRDVMSRITAYAQSNNLGTEWWNKHPIVILYTTQLMHLTGLGIGDPNTYDAAMKVCEELQ